MVSDGVPREMRSTTRKRWDDRDRVARTMCIIVRKMG